MKGDPAGLQVEFYEPGPLGIRDHPQGEPLPAQSAHTRFRLLAQPFQEFSLRPRCRAREEPSVDTRSAPQANAGREDSAQPAIGGDEPLADWERELLTGQQGDAAAADDTTDAAVAPLPETPAEPPAVTADEVAPVAGVPATGDTTTGTQGAQNG